MNMQEIYESLENYSILTKMDVLGYNMCIIKRSALAGEYPVSADIFV